MKWPTWEFDTVYFMYILLFFIIIHLIKEGFFKNILKNIIEEIKNKKITIVLSVVLLVFTVLFLDRKVSIYFLENKLDFLHKLSNLGNFLGQGKYLISVVITVGMTFLLINKMKLLKLVYISISSFILGKLISLILKVIIYRESPYETFNEKLIFSYKTAFEKGEFFNNLCDFTSMPSSHTIGITSILVVYGLYAKNKFLKFFYFLVPFLTAFGRVYTNKNWLSDTIVAYLLGIFIANIVYKINKNSDYSSISR